MKLKKLIAVLSSAIITARSVPFMVFAEPTAMRDITTMELIQDMGIGINLGNTYESCGDWIAQWGDGTPESYETAWGSPVITRDMIQGYADEGFGVLRVPVAWSNMMSENYTISPEYLDAVHEVIDWALDCDLYVIMNLHYDGGWLENLPSDKDNCMKKYSSIWTQLCDEFKNYGDRLVFESQNEELGWSSLWNRWGGTEGKAESYALVNEVNQTFVDIVRSSGGNNEKRHLLISGYNTDIELTCDSMFEMPSDPANHCAVSVHYYTPADFAILEEDADWSKARSTWGTESDFAELNKNMDMLKNTFIDNDIPVIIGEYGCPKNNKDEESVRLFLTSVCKEAYERQLCPVLWDVTGLHYNRDTCKMYDTQLKNNLNDIVNKNTENVSGDLNNDGEFSVADVVFLQKWLLSATDIKLENWKSADLYEDNRLDVFDLCLMKQMLIQKIN
ncbi:MAG: cellulase family glycosylhydrolase [Ruminococcus sp.]|nr:cellulase family glycosylhydrolase [Ruminococcus sp.]